MSVFSYAFKKESIIIIFISNTMGEKISKINWDKQEIDRERFIHRIGNCPKCGKGDMVLRYGRFGDFFGCRNYPSCKHTEKTTSNIFLKKKISKKNSRFLDEVKKIEQEQSKFFK